MTPASQACMERILERIAQVPARAWDDANQLNCEGAPLREQNAAYDHANRTEVWAHLEARKVRSEFESGASWAAE